VRYHAVMARTGIALAALIAFNVGVGAFDQALDLRSLAEAIDIGQSRIDDVRSRFHATYRIDVMQAPVDYIEVVTPFRRIALDAEAHTRAGARLYGQRDALATLGDSPARLDLIAELTFHPLNNYIGVPNFTLSLRSATGAVSTPRSLERIPRFGPRLSGMPLPYPYVAGTTGAPQGSQPLLGGSLIATFDGTALDSRGGYIIVIGESGKDVAKTPVNFGRLR
jgi:hypothetical protein